MRVLYFSKMDWFWTKQRPQQLVSKLARENCHVDYVCIRPWRSSSNHVIRGNESDNLSSRHFDVNQNLSVFRLMGFPKRNYRAMQKITEYKIKLDISRMNREKKYDVIILSSPIQITYLPENISAELVYDNMDDQPLLEPNTQMRNRAVKLERLLVERTNLILASSAHLKEQLMRRYSVDDKKVVLLRNAVDLSEFKMMDIKKNHFHSDRVGQQPVIGYVGSIDYWLDIDTIYNAARELPELKFEFYGPISDSVKQKIAVHPKNVHFLGSVPHSKVASIISSFSVCTMPFLVIEMIKSVNPVKIYEYLAAGKKVLAPSYTETTAFLPYISLYLNPKDFVSKLREMVATADSSADVQERIQFAKQNGWGSRADQLFAILKTLK